MKKQLHVKFNLLKSHVPRRKHGDAFVGIATFNIYGPIKMRQHGLHVGVGYRATYKNAWKYSDEWWPQQVHNITIFKFKWSNA